MPKQYKVTKEGESYFLNGQKCESPAYGGTRTTYKCGRYAVKIARYTEQSEREFNRYQKLKSSKSPHIRYIAKVWAFGKIETGESFIVMTHYKRARAPNDEDYDAVSMISRDLRIQDMRDGNFFITNCGRPKIVDFGL